MSTSEFDSYATDYEAALDRGISVSGEDRSYFARHRVRWLASALEQLGEQPAVGLDFGCGTGDSCPLLLEALGLQHVTGLDASAKSIERAQQQFPDPRCNFAQVSDYASEGQADIAYCNGVFHHIPPSARREAIQFIKDTLRPGGLFALWENNPWNPGTRYVMSRIPFDRDAIPLSSRETKRLLSESGFEVVRTDYLFVFPRALGFLRFMEPWLARWPLGAQYQVLARKPVTA